MKDCDENWHEGKMGVGDKMTQSVLGLGRIAVNCAQNALISSLLWLEAKDCDGNWHEEVGGHC